MKKWMKFVCALALVAAFFSLVVADQYFAPQQYVKDAYKINQEIGLCTVIVNAGANSGGTGLVVAQDDKRALVLTAYHVVEDNDKFTITWNDGMIPNHIRTTGKLVRFDKALDMAILETAPVWSAVATIITEREYDREVTVYQRCLIAGYPVAILGRKNDPTRSAHLTEGYISDLNDTNLMRTSAPVVYGNSGGGVFMFIRGQWRLVGILRLVMSVDGNWHHPVPHINYATRTEDMLEFLAR